MKKIYLLVALLVLLADLMGQTPTNNCSGELFMRAQGIAKTAKQLARSGELDKATLLFREAREIYQKISCEKYIGSMEFNLLKNYSRGKDPTIFRQKFERFNARVKRPKTKIEQENKGRLYYTFSRFLLRQQQLDSAIIIGKRALQFQEEGEDWKYRDKTQQHLALVAFHQQNFEQMEYWVDAAYMTNRTKLDNNQKSLNGIMKLYGALYYKTGNYQKALEKTKRALNHALVAMKTKADTNYVAELYNNIGLYYIELGDIYQAENYCINALQLSKKIERYYEAAIIYLNMGELFDRQNNLEKAYFYYGQANNSLDNATNIDPGQVQRAALTINNNTANIAIRLKRYPVALEALRKNVEIHKTERKSEEYTMRVLAKYYTAKKDYAKAKDYCQKAITKAKAIYGEKHPLLAKMYFDMAGIAQKELDNETAYRLIEKAQQALILPTESGEELLSDKKTYLKILDALAHLYHDDNKLKQAFSTTQQAVQVVEKLRLEYKEEGSKLFLLQQMIPTFELSIQLALESYQETQKRQYLDYAFDLVEKSKAMLLLDALKLEKARNFGDVSQELLAEERRIRRTLNKYEKRLFDAQSSNNTNEIELCQKEILNLKLATDAIEKRLKEEYPKYYELKYNNQTAPLSIVQASLDKETVLIEYFVGNHEIYIFGIYKDSILLQKMPMDLAFTNGIRALRSALTRIVRVNKEPEKFYLMLAKNSRAIFQKYVAPSLYDGLPKRLIVIPDGLLNYVPFDVLLTDKPNYEQRDFKALPYLIKSTTIGYHYSATLMLLNQEKTNQNSRINMLGMAADYDQEYFQSKNMIKGLSEQHRELRGNLQKLPGAASEIKSLEEVFAGDFYSQGAANESNFKQSIAAKHYSVIHLAMHGIVDAEKPEFSSLAFTYSPQDSLDDDLLHAYELNVLDLHTDLVVLSACETGFGKYERGEGVVSLGRGFMYAGVPSLVMTLWSINDQATYFLIEDFYKHLAEGLPKDEALKKAKLNYMETSSAFASHPFFWASFIHVGSNHPIKLRYTTKWWEYVLYSILIIGFISGLRLIRQRNISQSNAS